MMDENLVGYLLRALDPETQREVESYLRTQPEAVKKLELLRRALQPLAADREGPAAPPGLRIRTLARVAEYRCRDLPRAPQAPPFRSPAPVKSWWRRADVLVAASLLLVLLPLIPSALNHLRHRRNIAECQNNLQGFYAALMGYSDLHEGALPKVEERAPRHVAGIFVPILQEEGLLNTNVSIECPAKGRCPPLPVSLQELERTHSVEPHKFMECARRLAGCYAYSLGYRDSEDRLCGLRFDPGQPNNEYLPVMADRPPFNQWNYFSVPAVNSPNHDSAGQNVLYLSGRIEFCKIRNVGVNGNDIYLNGDKRPEAGRDKWEPVVGGSGFHPRLSGLPND